MVKVSISIHIIRQSSEFVIQLIFIALVAEYKSVLEIVQGYFASCNEHYNPKYNSTFIKSILGKTEWKYFPCRGQDLLLMSAWMPFCSMVSCSGNSWSCIKIGPRQATRQKLDFLFFGKAYFILEHSAISFNINKILLFHKSLVSIAVIYLYWWFNCSLNQ